MWNLILVSASFDSVGGCLFNVTDTLQIEILVTFDLHWCSRDETVCVTCEAGVIEL
jgi:hypothetical protein